MSEITATKTSTATIEEIIRYKFLLDLRSRSILDDDFGINVKPISDWWNALDMRDKERIADVVKWSDLPPIDEILLQHDIKELDIKAKNIEAIKNKQLI